MVENDYKNALKTVSELGFSGVEFHNFFTHSAEDVKSWLTMYNLLPCGSHVDLALLEKDIEGQLSYHKTIGVKDIIIPYAEMKTENDVKELSGRIRKLLPEIKKQSFRLGYHNHAHEFAMPYGRYLLDVLMDLVPELYFELDVYWAAYAGVDPLSFMKRHNGRFKWIHLKQLDKTNRKCVDLPCGDINLTTIIDTGIGQKVEHFIFEQEEFSDSPAASAQVACEYLRAL